MAKKKAIKKEEENYKLTLTIGGRKFTSEGTSMPEALLSLQPGNVKGRRAILILEKGTYKKERILQPRQILGLFNSHGTSKEINIKNITSLFI